VYNNHTVVSIYKNKTPSKKNTQNHTNSNTFVKYRKNKMGQLKTYSKLLLVQFKTKFKKAKEYEIPRCGVSFTKMSKLANEIKGIKVVKGQDTKALTFRVTAKAPEIILGLVSPMAELIVPNIDSPSKKDQKKLNELTAYIKQLQPLMKDLKLYQEASSLMK
jgi:hypothetical protein